MWGYNGIGMGNWLWGGGIFDFAVIFLVIILITAFVIKFFKQPDQSKLVENFEDEEALKILKTRFANGEIDEHEYLRKKNILSS